MFRFVPGWNLYLPTDGLLLRERYVHPVGVLLPDDRDIVDFRGAEVLRLRASDDGDTIEQILVHILGPICAGNHGRKYYTALITIVNQNRCSSKQLIRQ